MKWLADENFRGAIVRGAVRRNPVLDIVRAQDVPEISGADDFAMLRWAAGQNRVVLTHDLSTMVPAIHKIAREGLIRARGWFWCPIRFRLPGLSTICCCWMNARSIPIGPQGSCTFRCRREGVKRHRRLRPPG